MTVRVEMLRGTCLGNGIDAYPGQVVEVSDTQATQLIAMGRARLAAAPAPTTDSVPAAGAPAAAPDAEAKPVRKGRKHA